MPFRKLIKTARSFRASIPANARANERMLVNQGRILADLHQAKSALPQLYQYAFSVFSQFGEDGIIQRLTDLVEIKSKTFIEFGVEDFSEANCRFLMLKDNWRGMVLDGSSANIKRLMTSDIAWRHDLQAVCAFIDRDNVAELLASSGFEEDLGILSVDVDGVDYWLLEAITNFRPRILIVEYNGAFGSDRAITVPYRPDFFRTKAHFSNQYFGASLAAFYRLAKARGYALVGTNDAGGNAFFVRQDVMVPELQDLTPAEAFMPTLFRDSRDERGQLTLLRGDERLQVMKGLPVVNVITGEMESL